MQINNLTAGDGGGIRFFLSFMTGVRCRFENVQNVSCKIFLGNSKCS